MIHHNRSILKASVSNDAFLFVSIKNLAEAKLSLLDFDELIRSNTTYWANKVFSHFTFMNITTYLTFVFLHW